MTLYTPQVREYVRTRDWPKGLKLDVLEPKINVGGEIVSSLEFVIYRDNWLEFTTQEHLKIAATVKEVMETLRANGIPCYMSAMKNREEG